MYAAFKPIKAALSIVSCKHPLWGLGFRPFFLLAPLSMMMFLSLWVIVFTGTLPIPSIDILWHAHEMVFGFVIAIIAGFLLTASQNWTQKRGVHGLKLQLLVAVWLLARITFLIPSLNSYLRMAIDLLFIPALIACLVPYLIQASQKRNQIFLLFLFCLWLCNLAYYLSMLQLIGDHRRHVLLVAIQIIIFIICLIAGRIIPFFTRNILPSYVRITPPLLNFGSLISSLIFIIAYTYSELSSFVFITGLISAYIHSLRLYYWLDRRVITVPILLVLYVGYLFIILGYAALASTTLGWVLPSLAIHVHTTGAIGIMIFAMMTRITRGHTGRQIYASRLTQLTYVFIIAGSIIRILLPLATPHRHLLAIHISATFWILGTLTFLIEYAPMLLAPRVDGKPG